MDQPSSSVTGNGPQAVCRVEHVGDAAVLELEGALLHDMLGSWASPITHLTHDPR